jgi:HemY protein
MQRLFWFLVVLLISVWLGLKISEDPGYALFAYKHWTVEMPLWFAVVAFIVIVFVLYSLLSIVDKMDFSLYRFKNWLRWRRKYKSYNKTNRGLIELIEGHWRSSEYYLLEGIPQSDAPLINYLAAAKAAQEQGAYDRRDNFLRKAHDLAPQAEIAIGVMQAQLQFEQGQLEQALATLGHLRSIAPKQKSVLKLLERVYVRLGDWNALLELLPYLRKAKLITDEQLQIFEENTYQELLRNAANKHENLAGIQRIWQPIPKKFQKSPDLIYSYVRLILPYPEMAGEAEDLINKAVKRDHSLPPTTDILALIRLYGLLITQDPKKQLSHAESWNKRYVNQAVLLLTLGRLCVRCQLWGKARAYFEESLRLEPNPETYMEYGKLLDHLGEPAAAAHNYRDGLMLVAK